MELIRSFVMSGLWLHFAAGALALFASLRWLLFRPASLVVEKWYSSIKPPTFTPHHPDQSQVPRKRSEIHKDWIGLGHMSTFTPITVWLGGAGVEPSDCSTPALMAEGQEIWSKKGRRENFSLI